MISVMEHAWRLLFTGFCFAFFGIGALILGTTVFALFHLVLPREKAERWCRINVCWSFRIFLDLMRLTGVLTYTVQGSDALRNPGQFIIANHPSLIDIIFIVAHIPDAYCVVKKSAWKNPFMGLVMVATGYIRNADPQFFIDKCVTVLEDGRTLVMFPEGTRTSPGEPMKFQRGVARIALAAKKRLLPVHISVNPITLTKGQPWYHIPASRPHIEISVGKDLDPTLTNAEWRAGRAEVKALTARLVSLFETNKQGELDAQKGAIGGS